MPFGPSDMRKEATPKRGIPAVCQKSTPSDRKVSDCMTSWATHEMTYQKAKQVSLFVLNH
jgi:hypothetical protein